MNRHGTLLSVLVLCATLCSAAEPIKVACVGDSITFGYSLLDVDKYPAQLGKILGDKYQIGNFGVNGATLLKKGDTPWWKTPAFRQATDFKPNIVVIKLGTNDTKGGNYAFKADFVADLTALVEHFAALPTKPKIFLCKPVPVFATTFGITEQGLQEMVIPGVEAVAKAKNLPVIDLHKALDGKKELFFDNVHPMAAGATLIAKAVAEAITTAK
jgi:lysophospholipase L1-like esterase